MTSPESRPRPTVQVHYISERPHLLPDVKALGDQNKATLGFLPAGAFDDHAARNQILVATDAGQFVGYVLYRTSPSRASIVHLCVRKEMRGRNVARSLVERLAEVTRGLRGIGLRCRRDFKANAVWPQFGFRLVESKAGRSKDGKELDAWWYDHGHPDLFSRVEDDRLDVAIDANVFFDLAYPNRPEAMESLGLEEDWIQPHVRLVVTREVFNEASRNPDRESRQRTEQHARRYHCCGGDAAVFRDRLDRLKLVLPPRSNHSARDHSDLNQLAWASTAGVKFFVTRDERVLAHSEDIQGETDLIVLRPVDLILRLDDLRGEERSQPMWLSGTKLDIAPVHSYNEAGLASSFHHTGSGEKKSAFLRVVRAYLASPERYSFEVVTGDGRPLALVVLDRAEAGVLRVPMLRISAEWGAGSLGHSLLFRAVQTAAREERAVVVVDEPMLPAPVAGWMTRWGFDSEEGGRKWVKVTLPVAGPRVDVGRRLRDLDALGRYPHLVMTLAEALQRAHPIDHTLLSDIERALWPAKLTDADIPTYIVSIQPQWAVNLFDDRMSDQTLFGAPDHLGLSRENVYFRGRFPDPGITAPGRILWYVSQGKGRPGRYSGAMALRACSVLERVDVGKPGLLFKKYARLGTYTWSDVLKAAKGDSNRDIMALQFSDTELFDQPIPWRELQEILQHHEVRTQLQSPVRVPPSLFADLYSFGTTRLQYLGTP